MTIKKANKYHKCKKGCDIWPSAYYYQQRRNKALCFECGSKKPKVSLMGKLMRLVGSHGE